MQAASSLNQSHVHYMRTFPLKVHYKAIKILAVRCTGVGSGGAQGAAAPLNAGRRGLRPLTNLRQWVSETRCEIKLPAVIHSGMAQKRIESSPRLRGEQQL